MNKENEKSLILRKGIFVSVVDWVTQLKDYGQSQSSLMSLDGHEAELPEPDNAHRDGFLYFWGNDAPQGSGD